MGNFSSRTLKIPEGIIVSCHSQRYFWLLILRSINTRSLKDDRVICPNFGNSRNPAVDRSCLHQNSQIWGFYGFLKSYFDIVSAQKMPKIEGKTTCEITWGSTHQQWLRFGGPGQAKRNVLGGPSDGIWQPWGNKKLLVMLLWIIHSYYS